MVTVCIVLDVLRIVKIWSKHNICVALNKEKDFDFIQHRVPMMHQPTKPRMPDNKSLILSSTPGQNNARKINAAISK